MEAPVPALRYIKAQLIFYALILLFYMQQDPSSQVEKANPRFDRCSGAPAVGKGRRKAREGSESSSSSDPIESLVDPETMAKGGPLIGPAAARELDKRRKEDSEKEDKGSLNIRIHLDLHAKVKLDLEADLYGDIVIGLL